MIEVRITVGQFLFASIAGFIRQWENILAGRRDVAGFKGDGWGTHIEGAVAEFVVAKAYQLFWPGPGELRGPDVGGSRHIDARHTAWKTGELWLKDGDKPDSIAVLVIGRGLRYHVRGWCYVGEGRPLAVRKQKQKDRPEQDWLAQEHLRPAETLAELFAQGVRCG